jgi:hypothetical protein
VGTSWLLALCECACATALAPCAAIARRQHPCAAAPAPARLCGVAAGTAGAGLRLRCAPVPTCTGAQLHDSGQAGGGASARLRGAVGGRSGPGGEGAGRRQRAAANRIGAGDVGRDGGAGGIGRGDGWPTGREGRWAAQVFWTVCGPAVGGAVEGRWAAQVFRPKRESVTLKTCVVVLFLFF